MKDKKRFHFGVIFSTMDNTNQYDIWTGIVEYARKNDISLTAYFGTYQMTATDFVSHFETCFETVGNSVSLDGVIMFSGFIAHIIGNETFEKYASGIPSRLPLISVSYVMPGIPSVIADNISGMYSAVEHLIQVHGKKNIAFVKGPNGHPEAENRLEGYKRALAANGIDFDEKYIFPGNFDNESGLNAVKKIFETPGFSVDAIAASNDVSAMGVLTGLKNYNISVPADCAVIGFDDDKGSASFIPSISTARQDFRRFGIISAELLLGRIKGKSVEKIINMPPVFIARQSCGCIEKAFLGAYPAPVYEDSAKTNSLISYVSYKFKPLFQTIIPEPKIMKWAASLVETMKENPFSKEKFLRLFDEILISYSNFSGDFDIWDEALNILSTGAELHGGEVPGANAVRPTLIYAAAFVYNIRSKENESREIAVNNRWMVRRVAGNLVLIFDIDSLAEELYKSLPSISINSAIIGLYRSPVKSGDPGADRSINTLIGFDGDKKFNIKNNNGRPILFSDYSTIENFDFDGRRRDLFFIPLFFKDEEFGTMLMPFDPDISVDTYETLRVNISAAVKGAELINEIKYQNDLLKSTIKQANEASRAKSNFLSSMSHEMRTPMNAIIGMTAIGKRASDASEKDYALNKIGDASSHLLGVINDILDMSKIEAEKLELSPVEFNFEEMMQRVIAFVNFRLEEKKHQFFVNIDKNIPRFIIGDDQRLAQVITNLMSNAVKFTPNGGKICLDASLTEMTGADCELRISVQDSGIGISPEQQAKIFEAFEQAETGTSREYGGTGLGLVIAKSIVELMDGKIWIESELGGGAKFIFTVKMQSGEQSARPIQAKDEDAGYTSGEFKGKRLLLVEDIEINREIIITFLADTGICIDCAENGQEALEMVKSSAGNYDIIFMDIQMPKMNGYEATRAIRAMPGMRDLKTPIIAMTANAFKSDIEESIEAGMDEHLRKPVDFVRVLKILRKYL